MRTSLSCSLPAKRQLNQHASSNSSFPDAWITGPATDPSYQKGQNFPYLFLQNALKLLNVPKLTNFITSQIVFHPNFVILTPPFPFRIPDEMSVWYKL